MLTKAMLNVIRDRFVIITFSVLVSHINFSLNDLSYFLIYVLLDDHYMSSYIFDTIDWLCYYYLQTINLLFILRRYIYIQRDRYRSSSRICTTIDEQILKTLFLTVNVCTGPTARIYKEHKTKIIFFKTSQKSNRRFVLPYIASFAMKPVQIFTESNRVSKSYSLAELCSNAGRALEPKFEDHGWVRVSHEIDFISRTEKPQHNYEYHIHPLLLHYIL